MESKFTSEEVLNSLEGIQKAEPMPFLYTRIQARMNRENNSTESLFFRFIARPAFALSLALFFLIVNGYVLFSTYENTSAGDDAGNLIAAEYVQHGNNPYETNELP